MPTHAFWCFTILLASWPALPSKALANEQMTTSSWHLRSTSVTGPNLESSTVTQHIITRLQWSVLDECPIRACVLDLSLATVLKSYKVMCFTSWGCRNEEVTQGLLGCRLWHCLLSEQTALQVQWRMATGLPKVKSWNARNAAHTLLIGSAFSALR